MPVNATIPKILIVDDQPSNIMLLKNILIKASAEMMESLSGDTALALCQEHDFAVILLDVQMPGMDGYEVLRRLRMEEKTQQVPVLFVTGHDANVVNQLQAYDLGAVDFIRKPVDRRILFSRVSVFLDLYVKKRNQEILIERLAEKKARLETEITKREQVEEHLREAHEQLEVRVMDRESRLQSTIESALDAIVCTNSQRCVVDFNSAAERLFGYAREVIMGRDIVEFIIPPELCDQGWAVLVSQSVTECQCSAPSEKNELPEIKRMLNTIGLRADGMRINIEVAISSIYYEGEIHFTSFIRDVTDRKQLYRSLMGTLGIAELTYKKLKHQNIETVAKEKLYTESIINSMGDALIVLFPDGIIQTANEPACQLLINAKKGLIGQFMGNFLVEGVLARLIRGLKTLVHTNIIDHMDTILLTKAGRRISVFVSASILRDSTGEGTGIILVVKDITHYKEAQEVLREKERLLLLAEKKASQAKGDFLAHMSHEIRTPMNAIMGLTDLALQCELSSKVRGYLSKAEYASHALLHIINDILDFSKIEAEKLELDPVDFHLSDLFDQVSDLFRNQILEKNIELVMGIHTACPRALIGDALRLKQILMNLISNAIKFTDEGEIGVMVRSIEPIPLRAVDPSLSTVKPVMIEFLVQDSGIGMDEEQITLLFRPFVQADGSTTRKYGGTGLGLAICKRLVEKMGGKIDVKSAPGQGSVFRFTTLLKQRPEVENPKLELPGKLQNLKVLVADDSPVARAVLGDMLQAFPWTTVLVENGLKAVEAVQEAIAVGKPYHLVLLDWLMPELDGLGAARQIVKVVQATPNGQPPKMILLTAFGKEEKIFSQTKEAGMDAFLLKPILPSILMDTIMDLFGTGVKKNLRHPPEQNVAYRASITEKIGGARVLLVEDNVVNQEVACEILKNVGLTVQVADNGLHAIQMLEASDFDVVLMDIQMPEMDGITATKYIRSLPRFKKLPIIAMTAHAMASDREKCLKAGMNDHITKPINKKRLFAALTQWIPPGKRPTKKAISQKRLEHVGSKTLEAMPETLAGIDVVSGLIRLDGNHRLFRSLLIKFRREFIDVVGKIRTALWGSRRDDLETARRLVHTVCGTAGNIAALELEKVASALESGIREERRVDWPLLLDAFAKAANQVLESIETLGSGEEVAVNLNHVTAPSVADTPVDLAQLKPLLIELADLIRKKRFKAGKSLDALKPLLRGTEVLEQVKKLEMSLSRFDFEGAWDSLVAIARILDCSLDKDL